MGRDDSRAYRRAKIADHVKAMPGSIVGARAVDLPKVCIELNAVELRIIEKSLSIEVMSYHMDGRIPSRRESDLLDLAKRIDAALEASGGAHVTSLGRAIEVGQRYIERVDLYAPAWTVKYLLPGSRVRLVASDWYGRERHTDVGCCDMENEDGRWVFKIDKSNDGGPA